jgi:nucleoside-diphosphate-sugar epimerase
MYSKKQKPATWLAASRRTNVNLAFIAAQAVNDAGVPRSLYIRSIAVFGLQRFDLQLTDSIPAHTTTPYGISKDEA